MEIFINFISHYWRSAVVPAAVFVFCLMALSRLGKQALGWIYLRTKVAKWPADTIIYYPIKRPLYILCIILSAYLGLATSIIPDKWKSLAAHSIWTLFVFAIVLAILSVLNELILYLGKRLDLPGGVRIAHTITGVVVIAISVITVLSIWGVPTAPLLLLIAVAGVLVLLTLRDAAPNFFAGFQLKTWQHIKVNDVVRLENGEEGLITAMGWGNIQLRTPGGDNLIIPNSQLTKQRIVKLDGHLKKIEHASASPGLTGRELEIARLISVGSTNREIAQQLVITENTVKVHVKNMLKKLDLKNRQQLAVYAVLKEASKPEHAMK